MSNQKQDQQIKALDWNDAIENGITGSSGMKYRLESELSMDRYVKLQEFMIEIGTGMTATDMIQSVARAYEMLQTPRIMDAGEELRKVLRASDALSKWPHPVHKAVALLFNAENETIEERLVYDESKMNSKIKDWELYGLAGFFQLLALTAPGLKASSSENSDGAMSSK